MSTLFFKRFLKRPFQIASIVPSSKAMVERVSSKMDFTQPRVIAEYGPGEGVHSREIARRMTPDSHLLLFELDAALARALERQFSADPRVHVIHGDAASLPFELKRRSFTSCDYILSGIPFSILKIEKKRALLQKTHDSLVLDGSFIIYQVTNELKQHATLFEHGESEYFLQNIHGLPTHYDQAVRQSRNFFHYHSLVGVWFTKRGVQRSDHRHLQAAQELQNV